VSTPAQRQAAHDQGILAPLTTEQWLDVRVAATTWVAQIQHGEPGPEPLLGVIKEVVSTHASDLLRVLADQCFNGAPGPWQEFYDRGYAPMLTELAEVLERR
jgi:hypothetical protein